MKKFLILLLIIGITSLIFPLELNLQQEAPLPNAQGALFASDMIKGGKGFVYLSHRGIIPGSEKVIASGRLLRRDVDYMMDYTNGMLLLPSDIGYGTILVSYLYDPNQQGAPNAGMPFLLSLKEGGSTSLSLLSYFRPTRGLQGEEEKDSWLLGTDITSKLGRNSSWRSLLLVSRSAPSARLVADNTKRGFVPPSPQKGKAFLHWGEFKLGAGKLSLFLQEADKDFAIPQGMTNNPNNVDLSSLVGGTRKVGVGYQDQRMNIAYSRQSVDSQIRGNQPVAKEKGITKQFLTGQFKISESLTLNALYKNATDGKGYGELKQIELRSGEEWLRLSRQNISPSFVRGGDLLEQEAGIWAKEVGVRRDLLDLSKKLSPNLSLNLSQLRIKDEKGTIERGSWSLKGKTFSLSFKEQQVGSEFVRFGNLTEGDAGQLAKEKGLTRKALEGALNLSPRLQTSFALKGMKDAQGEWKGKDIILKGDRWQISLMESRFSEGFRRFGDLTEEEKKRFANEWGISKSLIRGDFSLASLSPDLSLSLTSRNIKDKNGGIEGRTFELKAKDQPIFRFSEQRIDPTFTRFSDLGEGDKDNLLRERATKKNDLFLALPLLNNKDNNLLFSTSITKIASLNTQLSDAMWGRSTLNSQTNLVWTGKSNAKAILTWNAFRQDGDIQRKNDIYNLILEKASPNLQFKLQQMVGNRQEGEKNFNSSTTILNLAHSLSKNTRYTLDLVHKKLENSEHEDEGVLRLSSPFFKGYSTSLEISFKESANFDMRRIAFLQPLSEKSRLRGEVAQFEQNKTDGKKQEISFERDLVKGLTTAVAYGYNSMGNHSSSYRLLKLGYQPQGNPLKVDVSYKNRSGQNDVTTRSINFSYPVAGRQLSLSIVRNPENNEGKVVPAKQVKLQFVGSPKFSGEYMLDTNYTNGKLQKSYSILYNPSQKTMFKLSLLDNAPDVNQKLTRKLTWELALPINQKLSLKGSHSYDFIERENKGTTKTLLGISGKLSAFEDFGTSVSFDYTNIAGNKIGGVTYSVSYSRNLGANNSLGVSGYYRNSFNEKDDFGLRLDLSRAF